MHNVVKHIFSTFSKLLLCQNLIDSQIIFLWDNQQRDYFNKVMPETSSSDNGILIDPNKTILILTTVVFYVLRNID